MKALQIKSLPATNTKPNRLKLIVEGNRPEIHSRNDQALKDQAYSIAYKFAFDRGWIKNSKLASGQIANGDYVYCICEV